MSKLLKAGFFRLKKDVIFWLFIFMTIGLAVFNLFKWKSSNIMLDRVVYEFIMYIGLFIAIFISIFVGKEHSEGIIRNKIIVGHSRISIYLSNLILSIFTVLLCALIYVAITLLLGSSFGLGNMKLSLLEHIMRILNTVLVIIVYCSIFNFIAMMCSEITISTIVNILTFIIFFIIVTSLEYTAFIDKYILETYYENGVEYIISQELNPSYPGEEKVKQGKTILFFIPQGQANRIANTIDERNTIDENLYQLPIYSITLIIFINLSGGYLFSRKELK